MRNPVSKMMPFILALSVATSVGHPVPTRIASAYAPPEPASPGAESRPDAGYTGELPSPPSPDELPHEAEEARAREAIEGVLEKYLDYWGPRYQLAPVEVTVGGGWAHGVAAWKSESKLLERPVHVLARRSENRIWQALMPSEEGLYLRWVQEVPETLVPRLGRDNLRAQAAQADALRQTQRTPILAAASSSTLEAEQESSQPANPILESAKPTATPTELRGQSVPSIRLLSDGQFVYGPNAVDFDLDAYLERNSSPLSSRARDLDNKAGYYSINPRVLLTVLEMRSHAVSASSSLTQRELDDLVGYNETTGYNGELLELSETLVESYYERLHRPRTGETRLVSLLLNDRTKVYVPATTNAGTLAILTALAPLSSQAQWESLVSEEDPEGFLQTYYRLFPGDDPLDESNQVLAAQAPPASLLKLPFALNDTWKFTGGPHDNDGSCSGGEPYSAVDFAPGVGYCVIPPDRWIVSPAAGTVSDVSCGGCQVKLNHQGGWGSYFYHVANPQVTNGQAVAQNQRIGNPSTRPSCGGDCGGCPGSATGTHLHYALTYNGAFVAIEGTAFEGWVVYGTSCYDGYLEKDEQRKSIGSWLTSLGGTCPAPNLVSPSDGFVSPGDTVTFQWDPVNCTGQDGYLVRIGTSSGEDDVVSNHPSQGLQTNITIESQWHNQDLYWSVRANASGAPWSDSRRLRIEPNQPGDCSGCSSYVTDFSFSPDSPSDATSVNISVGIETGFPDFRAARVRVRDGDIICEKATFSFSCTWDTRNAPNGDHCIVLEMDDSQGTSWDNPATCHHAYHLDPRPIPPPDPPILLNPYDGASYLEEASITLDWQASAYATDYRAHLWGGSGTDQYRTTSTTEWYVGQLDLGTYHWQVRARNESGGADSDEWTFTISESKPAAPSNLSATAVSASRIDLTWNDNSGNETGFRLYREGLLVATLGAGTESYQDTGLDCGTGYNYYVVAYNGAGNSAHSNTASATTVACPPTADFDAWPLSGEAPLEVRFHNISQGSITSCSWEYGDGGTGSSCSDYHYHTYTEAGTYTVQLSVTGPGGSDTRTRYSYINVAAPPPACDPDDDQVALFEYIGYGGSCVTLDIGDYPDPSYLDPVGNDNAESIKVGDDVQAVLYEHNDYGGISAIFTSYDSDLGDDGMSGKVSSVKVQPADSESPVVHWLEPVTDGETYHVTDEVIQLEATATDNLEVARVRFYRWDAVNLERVEIANDYTPPYGASLDCATLNFGANEVDAKAYDTAGNASDRRHIWIHRNPPEPDLHPYTRSGYPYPVVPSSSSGTHEVDTLHAGQTTYFDWYFTNSGNAVASGDFHVELWVGDTRYVRYPFSDYDAGWISGFDDWMAAIPTPGWHTVRLVTDPDDAIAESDETNNIWERDFYWTASAPYADDMESGTNEWSATGLWHQVDEYSPYPESHSGSASWWYGQDATGDYDTGLANAGSLTSRPIYIPESGHYLRFWYWYETETQGPDWDQRWVQISVDGGPFNDVLQLHDDLQGWWFQSPAIDLSGYAGHTIQIRFHFETLDSEYNGHRGWYIDDFEISTTPPPSCADSHEPNDTPTEATSIAVGSPGTELEFAL